jgi:type II secretion system protein N
VSQISDIVRSILQQKKKVLLALLLSCLFVVVLFPYNDLSDLLSNKVAQMTNNQVFLEFSEIHPSFFPGLSLSLSQFSISTPWMPTLRAEKVRLAPSLMALLKKKPQGEVDLSGFFNGQANLSIRPISVEGSDKENYEVNLSSEKLVLAELNSLLHLPINIMGELGLSAMGTGNLDAQDLQVKIEQLNIANFHLPPSTLQTPLGPLNFPELKLSQVQVKADYKNGQLVIESATLGNESDDVFGTVKGKLDLAIQNRGGLSTRIGGYSFDVDLRLKPAFERRASLFLGFIDQYKQAAGSSSRYAFRVSANQSNLPPKFDSPR